MRDEDWSRDLAFYRNCFTLHLSSQCLYLGEGTLTSHWCKKFGGAVSLDWRGGNALTSLRLLNLRPGAIVVNGLPFWSGIGRRLCGRSQWSPLPEPFCLRWIISVVISPCLYLSLFRTAWLQALVLCGMQAGVAAVTRDGHQHGMEILLKKKVFLFYCVLLPFCIRCILTSRHSDYFSLSGNRTACTCNPMSATERQGACQDMIYLKLFLELFPDRSVQCRRRLCCQPLIQHQVVANNWLTMQEFVDIITISPDDSWSGLGD